MRAPVLLLGAALVLGFAHPASALRVVVFSTDNYYPMVENSTATDFTGEFARSFS